MGAKQSVEARSDKSVARSPANFAPASAGVPTFQHVNSHYIPFAESLATTSVAPSMMTSRASHYGPSRRSMEGRRSLEGHHISCNGSLATTSVGRLSDLERCSVSSRVDQDYISAPIAEEDCSAIPSPVKLLSRFAENTPDSPTRSARDQMTRAAEHKATPFSELNRELSLAMRHQESPVAGLDRDFSLNPQPDSALSTRDSASELPARGGAAFKDTGVKSFMFRTAPDLEANSMLGDESHSSEGSGSIDLDALCLPALPSPGRATSAAASPASPATSQDEFIEAQVTLTPLKAYDVKTQTTPTSRPMSREMALELSRAVDIERRSPSKAGAVDVATVNSPSAGEPVDVAATAPVVTYTLLTAESLLAAANALEAQGAAPMQPHASPFAQPTRHSSALPHSVSMGAPAAPPKGYTKVYDSGFFRAESRVLEPFRAKQTAPVVGVALQRAATLTQQRAAKAAHASFAPRGFAGAEHFVLNLFRTASAPAPPPPPPKQTVSASFRRLFSARQ